MNLPRALLPPSRSWRWLAPLGVVVIAALAATGVFRAGAESGSLPTMTPAALVHAVRSAPQTGYSGTVVTQFELGLPALPSVAGSDDSASLAVLLSGSHTMQVWYGGPTKQRIALLGATDETDLFRNGQQLWQWSSADRLAVHTVLPAEQKPVRTRPVVPPNPSALTPGAIATSALASIDASTKVTVADEVEVAHRRAYELVLTPGSLATKVGSVHIDVDSSTKVPLGVQIYPRGSSDAAVELSFSSIRFAEPAASYFSFSPPADATVREVDLRQPREQPFESVSPKPGAMAKAPVAHPHQISIAGTGWSSVIAYDGTSSGSMSAAIRAAAGTPVSGAWGHGRLLDTPLLCVLVTSKGRVYAGSVDPGTLYAIAAAGQ